MKPPQQQHALEALMSYVRPTRSSRGREGDTCWEWVGAFCSDVPQWRIPRDGHRVNPRAVLLALRLGRPLKNKAIAGCGNLRCVNPHHALDDVSSPRERRDPRVVRAVLALTDLGWTARRIAEALGISIQSVHHVVRVRA